jgi:hypothetical protein
MPGGQPSFDRRRMMTPPAIHRSQGEDKELPGGFSAGGNLNLPPAIRPLISVRDASRRRACCHLTRLFRPCSICNLAGL